MHRYRPNVAALILNPDGELLVCERMKQDGSWQFPQGGIEKGESVLEALMREVREEVGFTPEHYEIIEYREGYTYVFPESKKLKKGFHGQVQTYFLCILKPGAPDPDVLSHAKEFQDYKWIDTGKFKRKWLPKFKHDVYTQVMWDFFEEELKGK